MNQLNRLSICTAIALALAAPVSAQLSLTTTFAGGNGAAGNMFDVVALNNVVIRGLDVNLDSGSWEVEVWVLKSPGSFVGNETDPDAWELVSRQSVNSVAPNAPTALVLDLAIFIPGGQTRGLYVTANSGGPINYTNGTAVGNVAAADGNLQILEGVGKGYPFGSTFSPRVWNGTLRYSTPIAVPNVFFPTIQAGINAAPNLGAVIVAAGTYNETIDYMGKDVAVVSRDGASMTTIDANSGGTVVTFDGPAAVLEGFTVTDGLGGPGDPGGCETDFDAVIRNCVITQNQGGPHSGPFTRAGAGGIQGSHRLINSVVSNNQGGGSATTASGGAGGIYCLTTTRMRDSIIEDNTGGPSPAGTGGAGGLAIDFIDTAFIEDCIIRDNDGGNGQRGGGGGITCLGDSACFIDRCFIHGNTGGNGTTEIGGAGGIDIPGGQGQVTSSVIYENTGGASSGNRGGGGGLNYQFDTGQALVNCTVTDNIGGPGGGGNGPGGALFFEVVISTPSVSNTIIWNNVGLEIQEVPAPGPNGTSPNVTYCDVQGGWPGMNNVSVDPLFVDAAGDDYHLQTASPVYNLGNPAAFLIPDLDIDGMPRIQFGAPDMGADEISGPALPGSGEDLALQVRINGTLDTRASAGDFFEALIFSPNATRVGDPAALVGQLYVNGMPPMGLAGLGLPYVHIDPAGLIVFVSQSTTASPLGSFVIPFGGLNLPYVVPMGLTGSTLRLQGLAFTPQAGNGVFVATGAWDVVFQ